MTSAVRVTTDGRPNKRNDQRRSDVIGNGLISLEIISEIPDRTIIAYRTADADDASSIFTCRANTMPFAAAVNRR